MRRDGRISLTDRGSGSNRGSQSPAWRLPWHCRSGRVAMLPHCSGQDQDQRHSRWRRGGRSSHHLCSHWLISSPIPVIRKGQHILSGASIRLQCQNIRTGACGQIKGRFWSHCGEECEMLKFQGWWGAQVGDFIGTHDSNTDLYILYSIFHIYISSHSKTSSYTYSL